MSMSETVAGNIRAEAARRGLNQSQLARKLGIAQSSISMRWRGERAWTLDLIDEVAHVLRVDPEQLTRARRDSNPQPSDPENLQPTLDLDCPPPAGANIIPELLLAA